MAEQEHWHRQEPQTAWRGVGLYHITLTVPSREPLLGTLVIHGNDATKAKVETSVLGRAVVNALWDIPTKHPEIQVLHYALMPDHLHSIWYVRKTMGRSIKQVVQGFWQGIKKIGRAYSYFMPADSSFLPTASREQNKDFLSHIDSLRKESGDEQYYALAPVFTEIPFIRPMGHRQQLPTTIRYLDMNPERLATKRLHPGVFRVQRDVKIGIRKYDAVGNVAILQEAMYMLVHVRHTIVEAAEHSDEKPLRDYMNSCVSAARQGIVMVSPFISPQEKAVLEVLLKERHEIICLVSNGFGEYYKPSDGLFEAVAEGRMLILSPWEYNKGKRHISRQECVEMNRMAEEICNYMGRIPLQATKTK